MAIDAIVQQDLLSWELIICDDASTDETPKWLSTWALREPRILLLRNEENRGPAVSRNRCIEKARGEFIAIMDADDACNPCRLTEQACFLRKNEQYAFVGAKGLLFSCEIGDRTDAYWFVEKPEKEDFLMTLPFVHASLMFRRCIFDAGMAYDTSARIWRSEDYDFVMALYARGYKGANNEKALYYIREDEASFQRRKYRYRFYEAYAKARGFGRMGLMPRALPYAFKPLIVGLIPQRFLQTLKAKYYDRH